jgi:hypothetical protein
LNDVKDFLRIGQIEGTLSVQQKQRLVRRIEPFTLKNGELYRMGQDNKLSRCLITTKTQMVMRELHEGSLRGHFAIEITQRKILDVRYWWPIMYKDVNDYCRYCDACQRTRGW